MGAPYTCPVCRGRGTVPNGFYSQRPGTADEACRTCEGTGVLWPPGEDTPGGNERWVPYTPFCPWYVYPTDAPPWKGYEVWCGPATTVCKTGDKGG